MVRTLRPPMRCLMIVFKAHCLQRTKLRRTKLSHLETRQTSSRNSLPEPQGLEVFQGEMVLGIQTHWQAVDPCY
jgi:hypothetical protein